MFSYSCVGGVTLSGFSIAVATGYLLLIFLFFRRGRIIDCKLIKLLQFNFYNFWVKLGLWNGLQFGFYCRQTVVEEQALLVLDTASLKWHSRHNLDLSILNYALLLVLPSMAKFKNLSSPQSWHLIPPELQNSSWKILIFYGVFSSCHIWIQSSSSFLHCPIVCLKRHWWQLPKTKILKLLIM